jgi:hypothetical protein
MFTFRRTETGGFELILTKRLLEGLFPKPPTPFSDLTQNAPPFIREFIENTPLRLPLDIEKGVMQIHKNIIDEFLIFIVASETANPHFFYSADIERCKKRCIKQRLYDGVSLSAEFSIYDFIKECGGYHPTFIRNNKKTIRNHLESEVLHGELEKRWEKRGWVYVWNEKTEEQERLNFGWNK